MLMHLAECLTRGKGSENISYYYGCLDMPGTIARAEEMTLFERFISRCLVFTESHPHFEFCLHRNNCLLPPSDSPHVLLDCDQQTQVASNISRVRNKHVRLPMDSQVEERLGRVNKSSGV